MAATPRMPSRETCPDLPGCLLIHGYGGSPFEMEGLAAVLDNAGFAVRAVCLPGHGEGYADFSKYGFFDWLAHVEKEYADFTKQCRRAVLIGFSMGGTLSLNLASRFPVAGIVALSSPVFTVGLFPWPLDNLKFYAASAKPLLSRFWGMPQAKPPHTCETSRDIAPWKGYDGPIHWKQLHSLRKGCEATRALMPRITAPLLAMQDARDRLVNPNNLWEVARRVSSTDTTVILTRMGENVSRHHMITTHRETAGLVADAVVRFCGEKTLDPPPEPCV